MDIDRKIREAEAAARSATSAAEAVAAETARCVAIVQKSFDDFREALMRHGVEPYTIVQLDRARVRKGLFREGGFKARVIGAGGPFHGLVMSEDGSLRVRPIEADFGSFGIPDQGVGTQVRRNDAARAVQAAGLGTTLAERHFYVRNWSNSSGPTDGELVPAVDWSTATGRANRGGGHQVHLSCAKFVVKGSDPFITLWGANQTFDVPLVDEFAAYIQAGGKYARKDL